LPDDPAIEGAAPEAAPTDTTETPAPEPVIEEADPFAPVAEGEPQSFPRDYVEKLRREGAKYRTAAKEREAEIERLKPLEDVFSGFEPDQAAGWQEFIRGAQEDPVAALGALIQQGFAPDRESALELLDAIFEDAGGQDPAAPAPEAEGGDDLDQPMTRREFLAMQEAEATKSAQAAELATVKEEAKELGYDPNAKAGSQDEFRYQRLLHLAVNNGNDLTKAHEVLAAEEQALVKAHMERLAQEAETLPTPTGNGGPGAPVTGAPDWKRTKEAATEFVRATLNQ
jgi:hypothetical protein